MSATSGGKGGSKARCKTPVKSSRASSSSQTQSAPRGIRLLPAARFQFNEDQRSTLARILKLSKTDLREFLDQVETHVRQYLTDRLRREGASPPARLRQKLLRIRARTLALLEVLTDASSSSYPYSHDGYVMRTLISFEGRALCPSEFDIIGQLRRRLQLLVAVIDAAQAGGVQELEEQLNNLQQEEPEAIDLARCLGLYTRVKYRKTLSARPGRPEKTAEYRLIARVAKSYQSLPGKAPTVSRGSHFFEFVHQVFAYALPNEHVDAPEYRRLIEKAVASLR